MSRENTTKRRKITTTRLPDDLLKRVKKVGDAEGRSRANMMEVMLLEGVKRREKKNADGVLG